METDCHIVWKKTCLQAPCHHYSLSENYLTNCLCRVCGWPHFWCIFGDCPRFRCIFNKLAIYDIYIQSLIFFLFIYFFCWVVGQGVVVGNQEYGIYISDFCISKMVASVVEVILWSVPKIVKFNEIRVEHR